MHRYHFCAMLGFVHKCVLGLVPEALKNLFVLDIRVRPYTTRLVANRHGRQLVDNCRTGGQTSLLMRSVDGLIKFYNALPEHVVAHKSVGAFQRDLQQGALEAVHHGCDFDDICSLRFIA